MSPVLPGGDPALAENDVRVALGEDVRDVAADRTHRPGQVRATRTGIFQTMADNARAAEWETIQPSDDGRLFVDGSFFVPLFGVLLADWLAAGVRYREADVFSGLAT